MDKNFLALIKQMEPIEFLGLARFLNIELINKDSKENRDFYEILTDMINIFNGLSRKRKRNLLHLMRAVVK